VIQEYNIPLREYMLRIVIMKC